MEWVLGAAVIAAIAWIGVIVGGRIVQSDRRRIAEAETRALEAARPGAQADTPIDVDVSSQIEPRAEREPCPRCRGRFHVEAHDAVREPEPLRRVRLRCGGCGTERVTWFRIRPRVTPA
jgi:hypothetical protein